MVGWAEKMERLGEYGKLGQLFESKLDCQFRFQHKT